MLGKSKKRIVKDSLVVYRNNKPVSVIIDIDDYNEMLERLEDFEDITYVESLKKKKLTFRKFDEFLCRNTLGK